MNTRGQAIAEERGYDDQGNLARITDNAGNESTMDTICSAASFG